MHLLRDLLKEISIVVMEKDTCRDHSLQRVPLPLWIVSQESMLNDSLFYEEEQNVFVEVGAQILEIF